MTVRTPTEFEERLQRYLFERSEEARAVRVGEKEVSEQAEIVRRYADLFTRDQLDALRDAEAGASGDERELLYRLRKTCEGGLVSAELAEREDELENRVLAERLTFKGEEMPLRSAQARLAVLPAYADREELGTIQAAAVAGFNDDTLGLIRSGEELSAEYSGIADPVERNEEEKAISLRGLAAVLQAASDESTASFEILRERWFEKLLGPEREEVPSSFHTSYMRRLSPLEVDLHEGPRDRGLPRDADRARVRPGRVDEHQARPRRPAAEGAARLRDRERPAAGRAPDHPRAGRAPRLPGVPPRGRARAALRRLRSEPAVHLPADRARPRADRDLLVHLRSGHARARLARRYFGLSDAQAAENAEATVFLEALLFRRYVAKLRFELEFWSRFPDDGGTPGGYEEYLTEATGIRYRSDAYLSDMDGGFYSADYLRAWIRSAQLRRHLIDTVGEDWWRSPETGEILAALFLEGTKPTSEEIAVRIGFDPLDMRPLLDEITV